VRDKKRGFTLVELITVLAIISLLVGILLPALTAVKNSAKEAKQKSQLGAIELGLTAFKNDYGDYPPSIGADPASGVRLDYCGAQRLAEALLGWDLLGFHPRSAWKSDGTDAAGVPVYDPADLSARKGPYIEGGTRNAFKLSSLFVRTGTAPLSGDTYVLCDVFGATKVRLPDGKIVKAGAPILYYKADTAGKEIRQVYDYRDNEVLILLKAREDGKPHPLDDPTGASFYDYIEDPRITAKPWPYNPSSYILISAGTDGIYGTEDDIRNFGD